MMVKWIVMDKGFKIIINDNKWVIMQMVLFKHNI